MINIKANIQNVECNTETDEKVMPFMQGTLYKKDAHYYLFCESVFLNNKIYWGKVGEYTGDLPTEKEVSEDMVENFDENTRKMCKALGNEPMIPRKITRSITFLPIGALPELFISEIKKSKVDIGNAIIIEKNDPAMRFEGSTYSLNIHDCTYYDRQCNTIDFGEGEYWLKVNPCDEVINTKTDKRGYPGSCGVENKNRDVIIIIKNDEAATMVNPDEKETMSIEELTRMIEDAKKQGIREIGITKQILIPSDEVLNDEDICLNIKTSE
ncbi:MAG: hypothetical protein PHX62_05950 [Bacilli bacterium]|nr:hypothetical protein [Bacilli bacterium]